MMSLNGSARYGQKSVMHFDIKYFFQYNNTIKLIIIGPLFQLSTKRKRLMRNWFFRFDVRVLEWEILF